MDAMRARRPNGFRVIALALLFVAGPAQAETMSGALASAYSGNPDLNQQRASVRATDESVPKAKAGWRPNVAATAYAGLSYQYARGSLVRPTWDPEDPATFWTNAPGGEKDRSRPRGYALTISQTVFDGFKTLNSVRQAETQVLQAREILRSVEQDVLLNAATAYMDVLRDTAVMHLRSSNVRVLEEQVRQTNSLAAAGQAMRADLAQAEASLAQARTDLFAARASLQASQAAYRQYIGSEARDLSPARSLEKLLPKTLGAAVAIAVREHPVIAAALQEMDAATLAVKIAESALYPTAGIALAAGRDLDAGMWGAKSTNVAVFGQISIPLYQGGAEYASIRQAKEQLGQSALGVDLQRDKVRAATIAAWGQLEAARSQILSGQTAAAAAEIALSGIRREAIVGQRTTFDILTAQQNLLNARVSVVIAQRDRIVASYGIMATMGRLTAADLGLTPQVYDPTQHYDQVRGLLFGTGTP